MKYLNRVKEYPHIAVTFLCVLIVFLSTYVPKAAGPANNGDFLRIISPSKILFEDGNSRSMWHGNNGYHPTFMMDFGQGETLGRVLYFLHTDFTRFDYPSSQIITIKISKFLNLGFNMLTGKPLSGYNLFWLFIIHLTIFAFSIYLILGYIKRRFGMKLFVFSSLAAIFVLCDQGYTLYFNSFFGEPLQYILTLLSIGLLLQLEEKRSKRLWPYFLIVYLMATAKFAWIPVGILFALAPLAFLIVKDIGLSKRKLVFFSGITVFALVMFYIFLTPSWIDDDTNFNSVFNGVLKNSATPEQDLEWLGLNPDFSVLQGWDWYLSSYPMDVFSESFRNDFFNKIGKPKILMFYLSHPSRFLNILQESARNTQNIRALHLTSVQNPEYPGQQVYRFALWEKARASITPFANFWFILFILASSAAVSMVKIIQIIKNKKDGIIHPVLLLVLTASAVISFIVPYVSNGQSDLAKQLFGFVSLFDLILFILAGYAVSWAFTVKKRGVFRG